MPHKVEDIRNIAFCGHGSAGKTTIVDQLLVKTGAVKGPASVDERNSVCDFDELEKQHKYTIECSLAHLEHDGMFVQMLDTPGYPDFIGQTIGALRAVDNAAIVINAHSGIEVNTRRVFKEAEKEGMGRLIVINKMDTDNIDFAALLASIQELFGHACMPLNLPIGSGADFNGVVNLMTDADKAQGTVVEAGPLATAMIETLIEHDEEVTARYFEGTQPTKEELMRLLPLAVADGSLIPIACCSAKTGVGLLELLQVLEMCALPPSAIARTAQNEEGERVELKSDPDGPLCAQVFKTRIDPFVQKLSYIRVYSGKLAPGTVHTSTSRKDIKLAQLLRVQGNHTDPVDAAGPGEIVAVAKTDDLHTGTSLGPLKMPAIRFPTPMVGLAVMPKARGDEAKLSSALHKLVEEDPAVRLDRDPQTKELVMNGMSELHLQLVQEKLKLRDKVEVDTKEPKIPYRETVQANAEGSYRHKKQSGGRGQFGEVHIRVYPFPEGADPESYATKERFPNMRQFHFDADHHFIWIDSIVGGTIPNNFLPAVEKGFKERIERGVVAGYRVQNVAVEVHFGKHHPVDSSEAAFKTAGSMAFRNVFQEAKPSLLEPIVKLHVTVPGEKLGDINSDMSGRRGRVLGMESAGGDLQTVTAEVPLAEVTTYARSLSSITGGQGSYNMEFSHYDVVPGNVQKEIIDKAVLHPEEEE